MILSHSHKFIFICSSKVGTTSMEHVLQPLQEGGEYDFGAGGLFPPKHVPPALLRAAVSEQIWAQYFKFVFVRNPWDWVVSQWFYNSDTRLEQLQEPERSVRLAAKLRRLAAIGRERRHRSSAHEGEAEEVPQGGLQTPPVRGEQVTLRAADVDALFSLLRPFRGLPGRDGLYQSNWVYDMDGCKLVDYVGRFETLQADFEHVCSRLALDLHLPHLNDTRHRDYRTYYSDEARTRVAELWEPDIRNFGYDFDGQIT